MSTVDTFSLSKLRATQAHATLVVRYVAVVTGLVNGKLAAHANFNPLTG
ncbi:MAG: hypothetical protein V7644_1405 [Actinomycetota bacterium]